MTDFQVCVIISSDFPTFQLVERIEPMEWVQIRKKFQITLPKSVREDLRLDEGDLLSVQVRDHELVLRPQALVDRDQAWYRSPEWQAAEREADEDLNSGHYDDFETMDDMIADLRQQMVEQQRE